MKKKIVSLLVGILVLFCANIFGQIKDTTTLGPQKGTLIIIGGGQTTNEIWYAFFKAAGGKDANIVIVPTAQSDKKMPEAVSKITSRLNKFGAHNITILHTRNPKEANTEEFVAPIRKASAVFFQGGREWRLADSYLNTLAHKELLAVLDRGGVIAGSSAGASIQSDFMLRGDEKTNKTIIGDHTTGLGFIHNVAIDQHVLKRNRQYEMLEVIKTYPNLIGIGIDESTAIIVKKDKFEVIGNSLVMVYDIDLLNKNKTNPTEQENNDEPFYKLKKGDIFNLKSKKVIQHFE